MSISWDIYIQSKLEIHPQSFIISLNSKISSGFKNSITFSGQELAEGKEFRKRYLFPEIVRKMTTKLIRFSKTAKIPIKLVK